LSAALGTGPTGLDAFIHAAEFLALVSARLADFGTNLTYAMLKSRATQLKTDRCLADFGAVHDETEVYCFNVFSTGL